MRRAAKVDQNQEAIVEALRASGWLVHSTARLGAGFPDIVAYKASSGVRLIEIKHPRCGLGIAQIRFQLHGWPVSVIRTIDEALALR